MRINKVIKNHNIDKTAQNFYSRAFFNIDNSEDVFIKKSNNKSFGANSFIQSIKNNILNYIELNKKTKILSKKYPDFELKELKALVSRALKDNQSPQDVIKQLESYAKNLSNAYSSKIDGVRSDYINLFGKMNSVDSLGVRSKGESSILSKLISKYSKGKFKSLNLNDMMQSIGDGYGVRLVLKDLTPEQSRGIVNRSLKGLMSYEDFVKNVLKIDSLDTDSKKLVQRGLDSLKEAQTNEFVTKFIKEIKNGTMELADDEFNNYGNSITSYFSNNQLNKIALAYEERTHKPLTVVNNFNLSDLYKKAEKITLDGVNNTKIKTNTQKAIKKSGYTTTQANIKTKYTTGKPLADMEMQIRGTKVNNFAEIEHVPYDIRQGKKTAPEYDEIKNIMRGMSTDSYSIYSDYLSNTYAYHRLKELGVNTPKPKLHQGLTWSLEQNLPDDLKNKVKSGEFIPSKLLDKITEEGLLSLHSK